MDTNYCAHQTLQFRVLSNRQIEKVYRARLQNILATHQPPPLPAGAAERIDAILQAAEARESDCA